MNIGIIVGSTQKDKCEMLHEAVRKHAYGNTVFSFSCMEDRSYLDIALSIGCLLNSGALDFAVSGCSNGQGMMLACNSIPNVLCGYTPTKQDAYLFARINNGNCISLPLGFDFDLTEERIEDIIDAIFSEEMGNGYPKEHAERKRRDTEKLKQMRSLSQISFLAFLNSLDEDTIHKLLANEEVIRYILQNGTDQEIKQWIQKKISDFIDLFHDIPAVIYHSEIPVNCIIPHIRSMHM